MDICGDASPSEPRAFVPVAGEDPQLSEGEAAAFHVDAGDHLAAVETLLDRGRGLLFSAIRHVERGATGEEADTLLLHVGLIEREVRADGAHRSHEPAQGVLPFRRYGILLVGV